MLIFSANLKSKCHFKSSHAGTIAIQGVVSGPKFGCTTCFVEDVNYPWNDIGSVKGIESALDCQKECDKWPGCAYFSWISPDATGPFGNVIFILLYFLLVTTSISSHIFI